MCFKGMGIKNR